ncbi:MAG TPA: helix-turn-helix transcriptional regulator [Trebonia sp.]|jgi:transcriptional regulator with XRE-family HTH domain
MARPETAITGEGPVQDLARALRKLRDRAGLSYREMAGKTNYSVTVLAGAASGNRRPTEDVLRAFVRACGDDPEHWIPQWQRAQGVRSGPAPARAPGRRPEPERPAPRRVVPRPDPWRASTPGEYVRELRALRAWGGNPTSRDIADAALDVPGAPRGRSGRYPLPSSTLADALDPYRVTLPKLWIAESVAVASCRGDLAMVADWVAAWQALAIAGHREKESLERARPRVSRITVRPGKVPGRGEFGGRKRGTGPVSLSA